MSVNKVILIGNVGRDPEVKYLDGGVCFARFSVATTERGYTTQAGAQVPERTEWHNLVAWRGLAQIIEQYVTKGTKLYIEGKLQTRQWDDPSGQKRYATEILIDNMEMLSGRREQSSNSNYGAPPIPTEVPPYVGQRQAQQPVQQPQSHAQPAAAPTQTTQAPFEQSQESDDLPF